MWNELPQIDQNGVIIAYEITYIPLKSFEGAIGVNSTNTSGSDLAASLVGLQEYVNYSIAVRAYTIIGPGPDSSLIVLQTLQDGK